MTASAIAGRCSIHELYLQRDLHWSPEQNFDLFTRFVQWETLGFPKQAIASIVNDDVETTEVILGCRERGFDLLVVHDVELLDEQLLRGVLVFQVREDFRFAKGRDDPFATGKDGFDEGLAETRRSPGDCEQSVVEYRKMFFMVTIAY